MKIDGLSKNELVYDLLKKSLNASSLRSKVIANNIANLNTQGFKRSYVSFEDTLKENSKDIELETNDDRHITGGNNFGEAKVLVDESSSARQDGNNVDIDNEMVNQASNDLMYNALINQVNTRLSVTKYIIDGGRG